MPPGISVAEVIAERQVTEESGANVLRKCIQITPEEQDPVRRRGRRRPRASRRGQVQADLDLIVDLEPENLRRFVQAMTELGYRPRNAVKAEDLLDAAIREGWKREKGMEVFSFVDPAQPMTLIDVFIEEKIPFWEVVQEIVQMTAKGITIPVVSLRHLKRLKQAAGRPQDLADIEAIKTLKKPEGEA